MRLFAVPARAMTTIRRIPSGGSDEGRIGYVGAVVANGVVHVAGTTAAGPDARRRTLGDRRRAR